MYSVPELASRIFYICCPWTDLDVTPKKQQKKKHKNNLARTITNDKGFPYLNTRENNDLANRIGIAHEAQTSKQTNKMDVRCRM